MQKFGLDSLLNTQKLAIELEIMEDQATALGAAGRKLDVALEKYWRQMDLNEQADDLLIEVADAAWQLVLQREFIGFTHDNLAWLKRSYRIPAATFSLFGKSVEQLKPR